ncbi:MAG: hypothetical protein MZW92_27085 [Comamonadaceae bacterium]|nr:hypothetical protein [Comamonadaceae bacterium]
MLAQRRAAPRQSGVPARHAVDRRARRWPHEPADVAAAAERRRENAAGRRGAALATCARASRVRPVARRPVGPWHVRDARGHAWATKTDWSA